MLFRRPSVRYGRTPEPETPYQKAAQAWDERIGAARVQARNWRLMAFGNLFLAAGLAGGLIWQAARGTVTPWVVEVDKLGQAQAVSPAIADYRPTDPQIAWYLARFIENVRSLPADPVIVRQNWLSAYDFITDILVKPTRPDVITNLVINTDRRTYHMELRSTEKTYMASVSWIYPQDQLIALRRQNAAAETAIPVDTGIDIGRLRFRYTIEGDNPPWRPLHAFDDGRKVYIEFPHGIAQGEMPPLFIIGPEGKTSELVNYRVRSNHMIVDRLFAAAELRLGAGGSERRVRIVRTDGRLAW
jgi:P-type conjugative transfer protein TrbG